MNIVEEGNISERDWRAPSISFKRGVGNRKEGKTNLKPEQGPSPPTPTPSP